MILYFNKNGQLLESLEYGIAPKVGETNFKIFAYFEDMPGYTNATVNFKLPNIKRTEIRNVVMDPYPFNYDSSIEKSKYFKEEDNPYSGFIFDLEQAVENDEYLDFLSHPGMWLASITLFNPNVLNGGNVTGLLKFFVHKSDEPEEDFDDEEQY